jgi:tRNA(fMet)-specific endonuclease VapC
VDGYLLDTSILSVYLDPTHQFHGEKKQSIDALPEAAPRYVSVIALAELMFGADLAAELGKGDAPTLREKIK